MLDSTSTSLQSAGPFRWILVVTDTVLSYIGSENFLELNKLAGVTLPAGFGFGGVFIDLEIDSGIIIAYTQ